MENKYRIFGKNSESLKQCSYTKLWIIRIYFIIISLFCIGCIFVIVQFVGENNSNYDNVIKIYLITLALLSVIAIFLYKFSFTAYIISGSMIICNSLIFNTNSQYKFMVIGIFGIICGLIVYDMQKKLHNISINKTDNI